MANSSEECLLIFMKNPERGKVKTRLAQTIGDRQALRIYKQLLRITKTATDPLEVTRQVWYSNYIDKEDQWSNDAYDKRLQEGENLGIRMQKVFGRAFTDGFSKVAVIGTDCAAITSEILKQAFELLEKYPVVIGPSRDGGYYLLGMSSFYPELFEGKKWSTPSVFQQTIVQLEEAHLSYQLLPMLNDIDTEEDLQQSQYLSL